MLLVCSSGHATDEECKLRLSQIYVEGEEGNFNVRRAFPNFRLKAGGIPVASKAYIAWKAFSQGRPDWDFVKQFDGALERLVKIGGWLVGEKVVARQPRPLANELSPSQRHQLEQHYEKQPTLLRVSRKVVADFLPVLTKVQEEYGTVDEMLRKLGIDPRMTAAKKAAIHANRPWAGGKYLMGDDGHVFYFTDRDLKRIGDALNLDHLVHGHLASMLYFEDASVEAVDAIDHGSLSVGPNGVQVHSNQEAWSQQGKALDIKSFFFPPPLPPAQSAQATQADAA